MSHPPAELDYLIRDSDASIVIADADNAAVIEPIAASLRARRFIQRSALTEPARPTNPTHPARHPTNPTNPHEHSSSTRAAPPAGPKGSSPRTAPSPRKSNRSSPRGSGPSADRTLLVLPLHHVHGILNVVCCALWSGAMLEMLPKIRQRNDVEPPRIRRAHGVQRRAHDLSPADRVRGRRQRRDVQTRPLARVPGHAADDERLCCPAPHRARSMEGDHRSHAARALWHDGGRHGAVESAPRRAPAGICRASRCPGVSARLVDGELQLKGPGVFSRVLAAARQHARGLRRWMVSDRRCRCRRRRRVPLLGRSSVDILKSGGHKISALEIEEVLRTHPAIAECVVVGVDDVEWGQRVCCAAELRPGITLELDELKEWARAAPGPLQDSERSRLRRSAAQKRHGQGRQT